MYGETPCNPDMSILDLEKFGQLGMEHPNIITVIDGTFASPILQKPLRHGINVSIHSWYDFLSRFWSQ